MQLHHLRQITCPHCGARTISMTQDRQHTNGEWFESREFECKLLLEWSPNFGRQEEKSPCTKSERYQTEQAEFKKASLELLAFLNGMKAPNGFVDKVKAMVPHAVAMWWPRS
jgi:hypothetical protein